MTNLDSIKKIDKKKSRQIILDLIKEVTTPNEKPLDLNEKKLSKRKSFTDEILRHKKDNKRSTDSTKNITVNFLSPSNLEKTKNQLASIEKLKKNKIKKRLEKIKKEQEEKKKREKMEEKIFEEEKKKEIKKRRFKKIKHKVKNIKVHYEKIFLNFRKNAKVLFLKLFKIFIIIIIFLVIFYLTFVFLVLKFKLDNKTTRFINKYLPVPAIISDFGLIDYYQYIDTRKSYPGASSEEIKQKILRDKIIFYLAKKYNIQTSNKQDLIKQISNKILYDRDINAVGINRINKIKELMMKNGNFIQIAVKYGDRQGKVDYKNYFEAAKRFGEEIKDLKIGDISDVLVINDGYYIVKRYQKKDVFAISYVFVKAKTLNKYLDEQLNSLKVWSFIDL